MIYIYSQDGNLFNRVKEMWVDGQIVRGGTSTNHWEMGKYKTYDRAKKVLEEIKNTVKLNGKIGQVTVYEMPKE
jgi:hypothetical protein